MAAVSEVTTDEYDPNTFLTEVQQHFPGAYLVDVRPKEQPVVDLSPSKFAPFSEAFQAHVDHAMELAAMEQEPRNYLGGSRLGEECARRLAYEYTHTPKDDGRNFGGKTLRIFDMGHDAETRVASYLRRAGFTLLTERADGKQFGFGVAKDQDGRARISGHIDGVITAGPVSVGTTGVFPGFTFSYPMLWENKGLNAKGWKTCLSQGVQKAKPVYYTQMQIYMAYLDLHANPALFTAINRDTGELYAELVPYDQGAAQRATDKGVTVISARTPEELPRAGHNADAFVCKWCDYAKRCWAAQAVAASAAPLPGWMAPAT